MPRPGSAAFQRLTPETNGLHIGRPAVEAARLGLGSLFEDDALGRLLVEIVHRPIEQAKRFGAHLSLRRQQRALGVLVFQMIDDSPKTDDEGAVELAQNRQMGQGIFGGNKIAGDPLFAEHEPHQARGGRENEMGQATHASQSSQ